MGEKSLLNLFQYFPLDDSMNGRNFLRISCLWEGITDAFDNVYIFYAQVRGKKSINKHKCVCVYVNRSTCSAQSVIGNIIRRMGGSWAVGVTVPNLGVCLKRLHCK